MASPTSAVPPGPVNAAEEAEAEALANERQLEFRARHMLTIDARAHTLLEPRYAREMRAVPLGIEAGRPVVAVADPSEKRLAAIRELITGDTKFVLVAPESLDALLKSRIFSESDGVEPPPAPQQKLTTTAEAELAPVSAAQAPDNAAQAPAPPASAPEIAPIPVIQPPAAEQPPVVAPVPNELFDAANVRQLAQQLAQAAETLIALQTQVQGIAQQFDQTRQELREQKEQLAAAAAKADQDRARIRSVAASLAEDVARLDQTKADLSERLSGLVQDE